VRNYAIGWSEVGYDADEMAEHFVATGRLATAHEIVERVRRGLDTAFWSADGVLCVNDDLRPGLWKATVAAFQDFGIVPHRVPRPDRGSVVDDLDAARRVMTDLGWGSAVVIGERAALTADEVCAADAALRAGGSDAQRETLVALIHADDLAPVESA